MFRMRIYLTFLILILGTAAPLWSKCADALIYVHGDIEGDIPLNLTVTAKTNPEPGRPSPVTVVKNHHFELVVPFNTFLLRDREGDRCGRAPKSVTLILSNENIELKRVTLDLEKEFNRDSQWNYHQREDLSINLSAP